MTTCATFELGAQPGGAELTDRALQLASLTSPARLLDLGCGDGNTLRRLSVRNGVRCFGADCRRSPSQTDRPVVQATAECLPFASHSFDAVLAECSLSLVGDRAAALAECSRVLTRQGTLIITDVYARASEACAGNSKGMDADALQGEVRRSGFRIAAWEDHSYLLKQFVFRYVMEHGTLEGLLPTPGRSQCDLRKARLGYFLMIAKQQGE